jgi:hypothetical protein
MAKPKTLSVKLHMDVIESARIVAAMRNEQISDMLSDMLRPILAKIEREEMERRMRFASADQPKRKPTAK